MYMYFKENSFAPLFLINGRKFKWQKWDWADRTDGRGIQYWDEEYPPGSGLYYNTVNNPARDYVEKTEQLVRSTRNANGQVISQKINRRLNKFDNLTWPYLPAESVKWLRQQIAKFDCTITYYDIETDKVINRQFYWGDFEATPCEWETIEVPLGSKNYFKKPTWYKDVKCNLIDKGYA